MNKQLTAGLAGLLVMLVMVGAVSANGSGPAVDQSPRDLMSRGDWWVIAGGGAPSSGTGVTLNDTLGQPIVGPSSGGEVGLAAGYWASCVAAPAVAPIVSVTRDDADVVLAWDADPANARY